MPKIKKVFEALGERQRGLEDLLEGSFCLGENHDDISPKKFLIQNAKLLKKRGFDVLFLEHFSQAEHQEMIDEYFATGEMPETLVKYAESLKDGHMDPASQDKGYGEESEKFNFLEIIKAAKEAQIRIVCLEKNIVEYGVSVGKDRILKLNEEMLRVIPREISSYKEQNGGDLKWIAFVGTGHVNRRYDIEGVSESMNVQDFFIIDKRESGVFFKEEWVNFSHREYIPTDSKYFVEASDKPLVKKSNFVPMFVTEGFFASTVIVADFRRNMEYEDLMAASADFAKFDNLESFFDSIAEAEKLRAALSSEKNLKLSWSSSDSDEEKMSKLPSEKISFRPPTKKLQSDPKLDFDRRDK